MIPAPHIKNAIFALIMMAYYIKLTDDYNDATKKGNTFNDSFWYARAILLHGLIVILYFV